MKFDDIIDKILGSGKQMTPEELSTQHEVEIKKLESRADWAEKKAEFQKRADVARVRIVKAEGGTKRRLSVRAVLIAVAVVIIVVVIMVQTCSNGVGA